MSSLAFSQDTGSGGSGGRRNLVPDYNASASEVLDFFARWCNFRSTYRCRHMARMARNLAYLYDRQWIELDTEVLLDTSRGYAFRDLRKSGFFDLPRPVTQIIDPAVENEIAALGKKEYKPNVIALSNHPKVIAAARLSKEILEFRMDKLHWPDQRDLFTLFMVACGTGIMRSYWDTPVSQPAHIGVPNAVACPGCGTTLSSPRIPRELLTMAQQSASPVKHTETIREVIGAGPEDGEDVELTHCPTCDESVPLQPFDVAENEVHEMDHFERPLGLWVPMGNTALEVVSPFQFFPQNGGVDVTPQNMTSYAIAMPRSLEWLEDRFPDRIDEIEPEDPRELMRYHPILGEWDLLGRFSPALDSGIYDDHAMWYYFWQEPSARFPKGREMEMAGGALLHNGKALLPFKDHLGRPHEIRKSRTSSARYKTRIGEFWGRALPDPGISIQNRLNGMDAQIIEARDRMGSPNMLVPEDMGFVGPEWLDEYGSGKIFRYTPDPNMPMVKPEVFGAVLFPSGVWQERDRALSDAQLALGPQEVEIGDVPKGLKTTSGLVLVGENANRKRAPRERAMVTVYEQQWETHLQLIWALRTESETYEVDVFQGFSRKEKRWFKGEDLMGQTLVKISKEASVDKGIYQREAAVEAQQDGLYDITTAASRKRLLELRGLPTDVNEDQNLQVECSQQQWVDYKDEGIVPMIDQTIDDPAVHYQILSTQLNTDEGKELEEDMGWIANEIPKKIAGWEDELAELEMQDQEARAFYGDEAAQDPALAAQLFQQATAEFGAASKAFAAQGKAAQAVAVPGLDPAAAGALPPQPPPLPVFIPKAPEDRIYLLWVKKLGPLMQIPPMVDEQTGEAVIDPMTGEPILGEPPEALINLDKHVRFRSVVDAYKRIAEQKLLKAAMGIPTMAAPQGASTEQGTIAPPGAPQIPGGGGGGSPSVGGPNA